MRLHRYDNEAHEPRVRSRSRLRNDTRSLLRSRPVQGILVVAALAQGVATAAVGVGAFDREEERRPATVKEALVQNLAPVTVMAPVKKVMALSDLKVVEAATEKKPEAKKDAGAADALALAEKYRDRGFKVSDKLAREIAAAAQANDIPAEVAFGLVKTESGFQNSATSYVGAVGLTQLMPATARWLQPGVTVRQLRDSKTNLRIGFRYLKDLIEKYDGDTELALLAYNRGPGTVDRVLKRGGDPDNGYADMVMGRRNGHK